MAMSCWKVFWLAMGHRNQSYLMQHIMDLSSKHVIVSRRPQVINATKRISAYQHSLCIVRAHFYEFSRESEER